MKQVINHEKLEVYLVAVQEIVTGQELLVFYGSSYQDLVRHANALRERLTKRSMYEHRNVRSVGEEANPIQLDLLGCDEIVLRNDDLPRLEPGVCFVATGFS